MSPRTAPGWRVIGASVVGKGHVAIGRGCDDDHVWHQTSSGLVVGVADGAGSASHSGDGAKEATAAVTAQSPVLLAAAGRNDPDRLRDRLTETLHLAREHLEKRASDDVPLGELATTLSVVVIGRKLLGVVHVGDGAVVVGTEEGLRLIAPDRGEYINETVFLTSGHYLESAMFHVEAAPAISSIAAMTDGLQLLALDMASGVPHAGFFDPLFAFAATAEATDAEVEEFLGSERVNDRTDDDKTLVLAVRAPVRTRR